MTSPSGSAYWLGVNTFAEYGGHLSKANYSGISALGNCDIDADNFNRLATDLAAAARVAPFCVLSFETRDDQSLEPLVTYCATANGVAVEEYSGDDPPVGFPTVLTTGSYSVVVTFATSYQDAYGVSNSFTPLYAQGSITEVQTSKNLSVSLSGQTVSAIADGLSELEATLEVW